MKDEILVNHKKRLFTIKHPTNNFIIDENNVKVLTNGTPEYIKINNRKYTYIDYKYAINVKNYKFDTIDSNSIEKWNGESIKQFFNNLLIKFFPVSPFATYTQ